MKQDLKGKKNKKQTSLKPKEYRILYVLRFCFPTTQNIFYSFSFSFLSLFSTDNFLCTKNKNHDPKPKNNTWLANPIPKPRSIRPTINIHTAWAKPLRRAPAKKSRPPSNIDGFRPSLRVTVDATSDEIRAAKYNDDVNMVNVSLLYWQYWLVDVSSCFDR